MKHQAITTVEQAIGFLRTIDLEVVGTSGGWIIRCVGRFNDAIELTSDSDTELIDYARSKQRRCPISELGKEVKNERIKSGQTLRNV